MLRKVLLNRFRGFRDFTLELGAVNALIGGNSSGKTSLLQAIRLGCAAAEQALEHPSASPRDEEDWIVLVDQLGVEEPARLLPLTHWRQLFVDANVGDHVFAEIELIFDEEDPIQAIHTSLVYGRNEKLQLSVALRGSAPENAHAELPHSSSDRLERFRAMVGPALPVSIFAPAFYAVTRLEEPKSARLVQRDLGSGDHSRVVRNLVARMDAFGQARMNQLLAATFGAEVIQRTSHSAFDSIEHLDVSYRDSNGPLELSSAGAGLTSAIALFASLDHLRRSRIGNIAGARTALLLLDEPEAHLHPRLQGQLGDSLATAALEFGVQTLLTTHSVEMINRIGRRADAVVCSIDRRSTAAIRISSETEIIRALDEFCDLTPYTALNFLKSRRVLFHEGKSDWAILSTCARYLYRVNEPKLEQWNQYVGISLDGVGNVSAKGVLEKLLTPAPFADRLAPEVPFRAVLVRDRDAERAWQPAERRTLQPHLESIELVWSRYSIESLFVQPMILAAWLGGLSLGVAAQELQRLVEAAIASADADLALNEQARGERMRVLARADREGNINFRRAHEQASADVSSAPEVWQQGKSRIQHVLRHVRAALRPAAGNRVRTNLEDLLAAVDVNLVGPGPEPVPSEIRSLFEAMLDRPSASAAASASPHR